MLSRNRLVIIEKCGVNAVSFQNVQPQMPCHAMPCPIFCAVFSLDLQAISEATAMKLRNPLAKQKFLRNFMSVIPKLFRSRPKLGFRDGI
jgi:hypothetical protein